jgi:hypothetical protein
MDEGKHKENYFWDCGRYAGIEQVELDLNYWKVGGLLGEVHGPGFYLCVLGPGGADWSPFYRGIWI